MQAIITKRPHRKSRLGCYQCKARKIKCDEQKPQCSACIRYREECTWPAIVRKLQSSESLNTPGNSVTPTILKELSPSTTDLSISDLRLLHHWTSIVYTGYGDQPGDALIWQVEVPKLACEYPFVMRGLLGVSALHLRRLDMRKSDEYLVTASYHQTQGMPAYRYIVDEIDTRMDRDNCHAVVAYSVFLATYGFASPHFADAVLYPAFCSNTGLPEWIQFVLGCRGIVAKARDWLAAGPMAMEIREIPDLPVDNTKNPDDAHLARLETLFKHMEASMDEGSSETHEIETYRTTLALLRRHSAMPYMPEFRTGVKRSLFSFVERVPHAFLELLQQIKPGALIMLAYICVLLKKGSRYWYMATAPERIIGAVYDILSPEWREWVGWPILKIQENAGRHD